MNREDTIKEAVETVKLAEASIIQAQANNNPQEIQRAHQQLLRAEEIVNQRLKLSFNEVERKTLKKARELLRHLQQIEDAIK
jgi:hypothetical protein